MRPQTHCYIVNLATAIQRRKAMEALLARHDIAAEFFEAIDGRVMSDGELEGHVDREKAEREYGPLVRAEIGTSLSHIHIYRDMVARKIPYAVILEDDVEISDDFSGLLDPQSPDTLEQLFDASQACMLQLSHVKLGYRCGGKHFGTQGRAAARPYGGVWLTSGYFITLEAARQLAEHLYPVWAVADYWNRFEQMGLLSLYALSPNAVWESDLAQNSSIAPERNARRKRRKTLRTRLDRIWQEFVIKPLFVKPLPRTRSGAGL